MKDTLAFITGITLTIELIVLLTTALIVYFTNKK